MMGTQSHEILLYLLESLPEEEAAALREELLPVYREYLVQLAKYESIAKRIRIGASWRKRALPLAENE